MVKHLVPAAPNRSKERSGYPAHPDKTPGSSSNWHQLTPQLLSREVIASSECGKDFGHHLESIAWQQGVVDAQRTAFVADGANVNRTIHRQHFLHMTSILDLMHAFSIRSVLPSPPPHLQKSRLS